MVSARAPFKAAAVDFVNIGTMCANEKLHFGAFTQACCGFQTASRVFSKRSAISEGKGASNRVILPVTG